MNDKQVKQVLKDASRCLDDTAKAWPKYPAIAYVRFKAAHCLMEELTAYIERPMGGEEE